MAVTRQAVFLDKDGTLIHDVPYNVDPARIALTECAGEALRLLCDAGYLLIVVTNQPGIAKGYFDAAALDGVARRIGALLAPHGVAIDAFLHCPHDAGDGCACRKPEPGMLLDAAAAHGIDLSHSWMVGDILNDVEAGSRAGCRTVLINNGNETEWKLAPHRAPDLVSSNLLHAAQRILAFDRGLDSLQDGALHHAEAQRMQATQEAVRPG